MYIRVNAIAEPSSLGYPWINGAIDVPVRHFECLPGPRAVLDSFLPAPLSISERVAMLKADAGGGAYLARIAASALESPTSETVTAFQQSFGVAPSFVFRGRRESIGSIVRRRFEGALKLLESGALLYVCGLPAKAGGPETDGLDYRFKIKDGEYWIALGQHFWLELFSDDRFAMLLMAALRVGYARWVTENPLSPNTSNVFCYAKFAFLAQQAAPPPFVEEQCPKLT